jgi:hypothetical protein
MAASLTLQIGGMHNGLEWNVERTVRRRHRIRDLHMFPVQPGRPMVLDLEGFPDVLQTTYLSEARLHPTWSPGHRSVSLRRAKRPTFQRARDRVCEWLLSRTSDTANQAVKLASPPVECLTTGSKANHLPPIRAGSTCQIDGAAHFVESAGRESAFFGRIYSEQISSHMIICRAPVRISFFAASDSFGRRPPHVRSLPPPFLK